MTMNILFACGGTAGHINPALAAAAYIRKRHPEAVISFAGNPHGMEARLVTAAGFDFYPIEIRGFQRRFSLANLKNNIQAVLLLTTANNRSKRIIEKTRPDIVVGMGGYVSGPVVRCAHKLGYKTMTHEQNAFPGVTTKLLSRYVDKVLLAVAEAKKHLNPDATYVVCGNPVREELLCADRTEARRKMGIDEDKICILSFGGSLGARTINRMAAYLLKCNENRDDIYHIHATGTIGKDEFEEMIRENGAVLDPKRCDIRTYIDDMADCLAACDLVISRAGAITLSEIEAVGRASILIPSPNVAENHQYHNAMVLARANAAVVIEEKDLNEEKILECARDLLGSRRKLEELGNNALKLAVPDACERISEEILKAIKD